MFILLSMILRGDPKHQRGAFLQFMHNFYALYLGVTPPTPENEKKVAALIIGGILFLLLALIIFGRLMLEFIFSR